MINPDYLRYESFDNLYVNKEISWGLLCFDQAHQKQEVLKFTANLDEILLAIEAGWEKHIGRNMHIL